MLGGLRNYLAHVGMFSRNIWLFLLAALLMGIGRQIFQVLRNQYLNALQLSGSDLTSVQGLNSLGTLVIALPAIVIIGRRSARSLLAVVALVNALAYAAQALVLFDGRDHPRFRVEVPVALPDELGDARRLREPAGYVGQVLEPLRVEDGVDGAAVGVAADDHVADLAHLDRVLDR
ncbi:MAG TPA: hypothetical protein PLF37_11485, partial [Planctomycetota bacterium]|nr:hypothetical protein [Planctomycetota bacterium]